MEEFIEKRKNPRVNVSIPLQYKELTGSPYLAKTTVTRNLSEGGVRFTSDEFIALSSHLVVEIDLASGAKPVKIVSKIVWIKKRPSDENYDVGNEFLSVSDEDRRALSEYIKKYLT